MKPLIKAPPLVDKLPISSFIMHKNHYRIDRTYQRDADIWEKWMEAYLIDTILRGFSIPLIYIHKKNGKSYIVDGQQRINTITKFYHNKIELMERFSKDIIKANNNGTRYRDLSQEYKNQFDSYPVNIAYLDSYTDEEIRSMFRRLQSGKPLNPGEKLNSFPGRIVQALRTLSKHKFLGRVTTYSNSRYKHLFLVSQLLFLEANGIDDVNTNTIFLFTENNENLSLSSRATHDVLKNLNFLYKVFREKTGEIEKPGWIISLYLFISYLRKNYSINMYHKELRDFFIDLYQKVMNAPNTRNVTYNKFFEAVSKSTTSKKNIQYRFDIMTKVFLQSIKPKKLDENRLFSRKQKLEIYRQYDGKCSLCKRKLSFNDKRTHYHHDENHIAGGATDISNGVLLCKTCHLGRIHKIR